MISNNGYPEKNKHSIFVHFFYSEEVIKEADPDDSWDMPNVREEYTFTNFRKVKIEEDWNSLEVPIFFDPKDMKIVYFSYVIYTTGCTFGYTEGNISILGIFKTSEEASKALKKANAPGAYNSWSGYFDRFESHEVMAAMLI